MFSVSQQILSECGGTLPLQPPPVETTQQRYDVACGGTSIPQLLVENSQGSSSQSHNVGKPIHILEFTATVRPGSVQVAEEPETVDAKGQEGTSVEYVIKVSLAKRLTQYSQVLWV